MKLNRLKIVAGNWKMNTNAASATELANAVVAETAERSHVKIVLAPPSPFLSAVCAATAMRNDIGTAAQNCHEKTSGAYTGEVSAAMLQSIGVQYIIIGHSERRQYFGESHALLAAKVDAVLAAGLTPIFCCGEPLDIRENDTHEAFVHAQLADSLFHLSGSALQNIVLAYEPVWAIGTGKTASPEQAQAMHKSIRTFLATRYSAEIADCISLLYGGSCNAQNAAILFSQPDIDGGLIGGASLKISDFKAIIEAFG
jgi:triosephosphate isomerase (TIM)